MRVITFLCEFTGTVRVSDYIFMRIYRDFVYVCSDALELNGTLITTEQKEYHESLAAGFQDIVDKLSDMLEEKVKVVLKSLISLRHAIS